MELHFSGAANPIALAAKLNGCLLFKRTRGVATARDNDVWCTFEAAVTKQKLMQACAMTVRHWGGADAAMVYQDHEVVDTRQAPAQAAASGSSASGSAASGSAASRLSCFRLSGVRLSCFRLSGVRFSSRAGEPDRLAKPGGGGEDNGTGHDACGVSFPGHLL